MIGFFEVVDRAMSGPSCPERHYDLKLFAAKLKEVVGSQHIKYDPGNPVPSDDSLADDIFEAGIDFYSQVGTYCTNTERIIRFTHEEIREALKAAEPRVTFGKGRERKDFLARTPESKVPAWCSAGPCGIPVSNDEIFVSLMRSYAELVTLADSITTPCLTSVDGKLIKMNTPLEVEGAIRNVILAKEALRRAGRPKLPILNGVATAVSAEASIAGSSLLESSDAFEIGSIAEMKVDFNLMNRVAYALSTSNKILAGCGPLLGGYCGGPEGLAVALVAYAFQALLVQRGSIYHPYPVHFRFLCNSARQVLWASSLSYQAISRNSNVPIIQMGYTASGPTEKVAFYETAATAIASVVSGASIEVQGLARENPDHVSPMEARLATEIAYSLLGMKRDEANEIVKRLLPLYEDKLQNPPLGKKYQECFDINTSRPGAEYEKLYQEAKKDLKGFGLPKLV